MKALSIYKEILKLTRQSGETSKLIDSSENIFLLDWIFQHLSEHEPRKTKKIELFKKY